MSKSDKSLFAVVLITLLAVAAILYIGHSNCVADGGAYVRGLFWFECVK